MSWGNRRRFYGGSSLSLGPKHSDKVMEITPEMYFAAKNKREVLWSRTVKVQCLGGKFHHIKMEVPGRITLMEHRDVDAEKTMMGLGGDEPPCLKLKALLLSQNAQALENRPLFKAFCIMRQRVNAIHNLMRNKYTDELVDTSTRLAARLDQRIETAANDLRWRVAQTFKGHRSYGISEPKAKEPWQSEVALISTHKMKGLHT